MILPYKLSLLHRYRGSCDMHTHLMSALRASVQEAQALWHSAKRATRGMYHIQWLPVRLNTGNSILIALMTDKIAI